jgi:hypothetical protein
LIEPEENHLNASSAPPDNQIYSGNIGESVFPTTSNSASWSEKPIKIYNLAIEIIEIFCNSLSIRSIGWTSVLILVFFTLKFTGKENTRINTSYNRFLF